MNQQITLLIQNDSDRLMIRLIQNKMKTRRFMCRDTFQFFSTWKRIFYHTSFSLLTFYFNVAVSWFIVSSLWTRFPQGPIRNKDKKNCLDFLTFFPLIYIYILHKRHIWIKQNIFFFFYILIFIFEPRLTFVSDTYDIFG